MKNRFDVTGKLILKSKAHTNNLNLEINNLSRNLDSAVYIIQISQEKSNYIKTEKLFVSNSN